MVAISPSQVGRGGADTEVGLLGEPQEQQVVDRLAVQRDAQRVAELDRAQQLAQLAVVLVLEVVVQPDLVAGGEIVADADAQLIVAVGLAGLQHREVLEHLEVALRQVHLASDAPQDGRLLVGEHLEAHLVDVGKLVAGRIHLPVVGVALHHGLFGRVVLGQLVGGVGGDIGVDRAVLALEVLPGLAAGVVRVELLEVVRRGEQRAVLGAGGAVQHVQEPRVGAGELEADGVVVDLYHLHRLAVHLVTGRHRGLEALVHLHLVPHEHDVVDTERFAVRPLDAFAQHHRDAGRVVIPLPALGDTGAPAVQAVGGDGAQVNIAARDQTAVQAGLVQHPLVGVAELEAAEGAAVGADAVHHVLNQRFGRQPLVDRWQVAAGHHGGKHRRL
ncbi:MAG: hypothetical protein OXC12_07810 [Spirochaetaceae bacterium]|nr:hypothetical protein [Spirochaetaceae bacterium]